MTALTIWKLPIPLRDGEGRVTDRPEMAFPAGARVLTIQVQRGVPTIWALVDPNAETPETRRFAIVGTGQSLRNDVDSDRYVGTWQQDGYVFHLFEVLEVSRD